MAAKWKCFIGGVIFSFSILVNSAFCTLYVDDIQISLLQGTWYHGQGQYFQPTPVYNPSDTKVPITMGLLSIVGSSSFDYEFDGTLEITASSLVTDLSEDGVAEGQFAGGSTLTITGSIWLGTDPTNKIIDNEVILIAEMSSADWILAEIVPPGSDTVRGQSAFSPTGGALKGGTGDETLTIADFLADYTFTGCTPSVVEFGATSYSCTLPQIQITAVPEPASMVLLCIGGLVIFRRRQR